MMANKFESLDLSGFQEAHYYQALLSGIDAIVISTDTNFIIQTWNTAAEKIYKLTASQVIGKKMQELLLHNYVNTTRSDVIKQLSKENSWRGVVTTVIEGKTIFLQTSLTVMRNTNGEKIGYIGISKNVTDEINTKKTLHNFVSVLTLLEESFLIVDTDYTIAFMRPKGNVQKFFNSDYKVGDNAFRYIPPEYLDEVQHCYMRAFNGETINYDAVSSEEPKLYFNVTYAPLKDDYGNVASVCVIIKDFTAQKEFELLQEKKAVIEKKLFESRKFFEEFMQKSPLLAWIVDKAGYIQYMNPAYMNAFQITSGEMGKNIFELFPKELANDYFENNKKVLATNATIETIKKGRIPGKNKNYKVIKFPVQFKGQRMVGSWAIDISDQIKNLENLSLLNEHKNKLVSLIAHDLRGPLGTNVNFLKAIIDDYSSYTTDELLVFLKQIAKSSVNCFELVDDLLRWARSQLGGISYNPVSVNMQKEILKITDSLWDLLQQKKLQLKTTLNYCNNVFVDADMFAITLRNLITNAIKFSYESGEIEVVTECDNGFAKVTVQDFGTGMHPQLVQKLLNNLNHESIFGTKGERGSGLGLIMAKDYIEQNGGALSIESTINEGSSFSFTVPLK